jgi:triosephosphate isomerase
MAMKPLIAANWKMNKDIKEAVSFINKFKNLIKNIKNTEIVICAPFTSLSEIKKLIKTTNIKLGAQNMHFEEKGAFTGEISGLMLKDIVEYVILGHSERRQIFHETDDLINKKIESALKNKLKPILCIGETLQQRNNNKTMKIIKNQLKGCLKNVSNDEMKNIVVAYEPVWAIGTGKNATPEQAEEGTNLRIVEEGEAGEKGAEPGDLYIIIHVKEHEIFERHGDDIYIKVPIPFTIAALGGEIEVPTLDEKAKLKIPAGTQNNTIFRMKGKGVPYLHGHGTGNENVEVVIEVPEKLSKKQKELLKEFEKGNKKKKGFLGKMF